MKKFYAMALCAIVCASSAEAAPNRFTIKRDAKKSATKTLIASRSDAAKIWRPVSTADYMYEEGEWILMGETTFEYDARGNATRQTVNDGGYLSVVTLTYNDDNMVTERLETEGEEGGDLVNSAKRTYVYDSVVKDFCIERMGYNWADDGWVKNFYCETNKITRNTDGNITEIIKSLPLGEDLTPAYKCIWHYDATTGKADEYYYYTNTNGAVTLWEPSEVSYKNIVWQNTDGQMTKDFLELFEGANRLSSAEAYYEGELDGHIFATYSGENDYTVKNTTIDPSEVGEMLVRETIDDNGSYRISIFSYVDEDDNIVEEPFSSEVETVTIDEHGNIIEDRLESTYGDEPPITASEKYEYTYDDNGNPTEMITSVYDEEAEDFVPQSKTVYSDYIDVTSGTSGIENIIADGADQSVEVYNLNGVKVADSLNGLDNGFYIVRHGSSVSKVAVK